MGVCNSDKRKTQFKFEVSTGFIHHFSDKTEWNNFCVQADEGNNSRLRVAVCDESDDMMVWDYDLTNGHVFLKRLDGVDGKRRCISVGPIGGEGAEDWLKIDNRCMTNVFGRFV